LQGTRNLLYLSRIHPKKGCDLLIAAFAKAALQDPALHLVLAGPGDEEWVSKLKAQAAQLGVQQRVTFTGMLQGDVKWGAYDAADAFVLPSHQENFGIVVAEALASGVPVLTTYQVNIWREVQQEGAGIIHADTQAGADQLLTDWLALTLAQRQTMRANAQACFQKHFRVQTVTQHLLAALHDAVAQNPPPPHTFVGSLFAPQGAEGGCYEAAGS
jgi:glycosyltransferase involved in cell wall biosynthesis